MNVHTLQEQPVLVKLSNASLGWYTGVVHDYETGKVVGIQVRSLIDRRQRLVPRAQIKEIQSTFIELLEWEEINLEQTMGILLKHSVRALETDTYIGRVSNIVWESSTGDIVQIYVDAPWWKFWSVGYIIPKQAIIAMDAKAIIVEHYRWYKVGKLVQNSAPTL